MGWTTFTNVNVLKTKETLQITGVSRDMTTKCNSCSQAGSCDGRGKAIKDTLGQLAKSTVMGNFMCPLDWVKGQPGSW